MAKMLRMSQEEYDKRQAKVKPHKLPEMVKTLSKPQKRKQLPTESQEQAAVIAWADTHPIAKHIFSIPNGAHKSPAMAAKFKREGLRAGYPDLGLDVARKGYHGLRLELKRLKGSVTAESQRDWGDFLRSQGYFWVICFGAADAISVIEWYLEEV